MNNDWTYTEIAISEVVNLIDDSYIVEVDSPDGWVKVDQYVDKGVEKEYVLTNGVDHIRCSGNHLFETDRGWKTASHICADKIPYNILTRAGYTPYICITTDNYIPVVDITVLHDNHRYYTGNVSSHNTGVGKTLVKCHIAAATLKQSKNVLYITMEMAEERIAERIDANLMNLTLDELKVIDRETFNNRFDKIRKKTQGRLIIKEYPTATAHSGHFRALLEELRIKKNFIPDLIIIDYLNICASARMRMGASVNSYTYIKSIAEELRGLAVEYNVPILSSTQTNRDGYANSDVDLSNVSESAGLSSTADLVVAVIRTEELDELNQLMVKQLKNRYNDLTKNKRFVLGVERSKMKLYEVENSAQTLADSGTQEDCGASWKGNIKTRASFGDFKY